MQTVLLFAYIYLFSRMTNCLKLTLQQYCQGQFYMPCINVEELVNISKIADIPSTAIIGLEYIFLACDVMGYTDHIQGMRDAFLV
jgi:hypothetical protein